MPDNIIDTLNLQINGESSQAISAVTEIINKLDNLKNKVGELNKIKVSLGIGPKSGVNLKAFGEAIDGLNLEKFKQFAQATSLVTKMSFGISKDTGDNLSMFAMALDDLDVGKMFEFGAATNTIAKVSLGMSDKTGEYLSGFATALNTLDLEKLREFSAINESFANVSTGLSKKTNENLVEFGVGINAINVDKLKTISKIDFSNLKPLAEAGKYIGNFTEHVNKLSIASNKALKSQEHLANATKTVARATRASGHSFSFASTMVGRFLASVKRIAIHRLIRNMLRSLTQGFSEGIENLYYWSQAVGTSFAPRMDQLATSVQYLKNGFASMFSPLIEYAIPILDRLIDKVVDAFNVVQELFARLTGQATWNKAIKYPVTYKDQLDDATKSAKELQNILMDFDELNVINTPRDSSRGSAADAKDYSAMFELMETSTSGSPLQRFGKLFEDIGSKVEKVVGIGQKFWEFFKGLNFTPIETSLSRLWDTLSPIIDELIADADWFREKVLQPITQFLVEKGIPAAIDTLNVALENTWKAIKPIKDGLKSFWDQNGEWITDLIEDLAGQAFEKIQEGFNEIGKFFDKNGNKIKNIFTNLSTIVKKLEPFIRKVADAIGTTAWDSFIDGIKSIFDALEPILDLLDGVLSILSAIFLGVDKDGEKVKYGFEKIGESILKMFLTPLQLVMRALAGIVDFIAPFMGDQKQEWKDLADQIRNSADALNEFGEDFPEVTEEAKKMWYETDRIADAFHRSSEAEDEFVTYMFNHNLSIEDNIEGLIATIQKVGPKSREEFELLQFWSDWCRKYGVDPLFTDLNNTNKALDNSGKSAQKGFGETKYFGVQAANEIRQGFITGLDPALAFQLAQQFGQQIRNGLGGGFTLPIKLSFQGASNYDLLKLTQQAMGTVKFASGGFPEMGSLFIAGEVPGQSELLGTISGRTAVAGGAEITGIREAVELSGQRQENLLRTLINAVNAKDLTLVANSATGRWVNKALKSYAGVTG